mgnify:CR=1 FL=1
MTVAAIKQRKKRGLLTLSVTVTVLAGLSAAILITMGLRGEKLLRGDTIFPNISISGVAVGGMTAEEAELAVKTALQAQYAANFEVRLPDRTITLKADKLSVSADLGDAVMEAVAYGRAGTAFDALAARDEVIDVPANAVLTFDEGYIRQVLDAAAESAFVDATLPTAELDHREQVITVTLGTDGRTLDTQKLFDAVLTALSSGETALDWDYTAVPAGVPDLEALHETLDRRFDLAAARAQMAACSPGEGFSIPLTKLTTHN